MDRDMGDLQIKIGVDASGAKQGLEEVSRALETTSQKINELNSADSGIENIGTEAKEAAEGIDKLGKESEETAKQVEKIASVDLSKIGAGLESAASKLQSFGMAATVLAAPFEIAAAAGINAFSDFESNMAKIFTLMPDITEQAMGEISQQMKDFSMEMGADLGAAQQAAYDALSAGISPDNMMKFLEVAQKAGVAGMSDVSVSVDGLTSIMNAYGLSVEDATGVSDVMFKSVEKGKIEFDEFAANIGKVAPSAAGLGVVFEDVAAMIAQITSLGVSPSETMTAINSLMKDLASPAADIYQLFEQLTGKAFTDFVKEGGSVIDALEIINDYMIKTGKNAYSLTMNAETAKALSNLTGGNMENLIKFSEEMDNAAGSTEKAYSKVANTLQFAMDKLKAQFRVMGVEIGEALAPTVEKFTKWLSENADEIKNFAVGVAESAVPALEKLFDVLKGGMDAFNGMSPETKGLLTKLLGGGAVALGVGGPAMMGAGIALSPIASLVTILGKLGPAAGEANTVIPTLTGVLSGLFSGISGGSAASGILTGLATAISGIAAAGAGIAIGAWIYDIGNFRDELSDVLGDMSDIASGLMKGISGDSQGWIEVGKGIGSLVADGISLGIETIKAAPEVVANVFGDAAEAGGMIGVGLMSAIFDVMREDASKQRIEMPKPDVSSYSQAGTEAGQDFKTSVENFFKSNPITASAWDIGMGAGQVVGDAMAVELQRNFQKDVGVQQVDRDMRNFEEKLFNTMKNAKKDVKVFSSQSQADINNAMKGWQDDLEKTGKTFDQWFEDLNPTVQKNFLADQQKYIQEFGSSLEDVRNKMNNFEFKPVEWDASTIFYSFMNDAYTPIRENPIMIDVDEGNVSGAFEEVYNAWMETKAKIEANPVGINYDLTIPGSKGNQRPNTNLDLAPVDPKVAQLYLEKGAATGAEEGAAKGVARGLADWLPSRGISLEDTAAIMANPALRARYQSEMDRETSGIGWGKSQEENIQSQDQNTTELKENTKSNNKNAETVSELYKQFKDWDTYSSKYALQHKGASVDEIIAAYENDKRISNAAGSSSDSESESSTQANTKSKNENTEANKKNTASKTDEQKASESHQNALDKAIKDMGKWDIQDKWDRKKIEEDRPEFKDYDSIEAYNKAFSQYNDKLDSLTDARAEKEELLAYDLGITTEELRRLASGNKEVKTSGDEVVSTFEKLASIDFSKISDPFSQSSAGPSTDLTQSEIIALAATRGINTEVLSYDELVKSLINAGVLDKSGKFAYDPNKTFESQYQQNETVSRIFEEAKAEWEKTNKYSSGVAKDMDSVLKSLNEIITGDIDNEDVKKYLDAYKEATGDATEYEEKHTKQLETLLEAYDKASDFQDYYAKAISEGGLSTDEQTEVSKQYNDILKLLAESGLDATKGIEGLPPALQDLMRALMNIVDNVKGHADSQTGEGLSTKAPFSAKYPVNYGKDVAENSNKLFGEIKSDFASLQSQYAKGAISASTYFDELRKLSIETDTISISTNTLRGEQRGFTLQFENDIQEIFRKVEAGKLTEAEAVKLLDNHVNNLKSSTITLNSSLKNTTKETKDLSQSSADLIKANGGFKDMQELYGLMGMSAKEAEMYQRNYNLAISDGQITYKDAQQTIQRMNKFTDDQTEVSKDNISAMESLMKAQQKMTDLQETYNQLNSDGTISMADMNIMMEKQAEVNKLVTDATTMAADSSGELPPALQAISDAIQGLVSVCISMAQQAASAASQAQSAVSNIIKAGNNTQLYTNPSFNPATFAQRPDSGFSFASGGPVTQNGPAYLHQGEYVLRRDEVNKPTSKTTNVNLRIDMSNSRFGNNETKKLPRKVAKEITQAFGRYGI